MFQVRGSSRSASGLPWLSAMSCSQTAASSGPCRLFSSKARASLSPSPPTVNSGSPRDDFDRRRRYGRRTPQRSAPRGVGGRRIRGSAPTHRRATARRRSRQRSGCLSAASASNVSVASPTRNRSGAGPALEPEDRCQRLALRPGQSIKLIEHRGADLVEAAVRELHLRLDADGLGDAPASESVEKVRAMRSCRCRPRREGSNAALPGERVRQEPLERLAFAGVREALAALFGPRPAVVFEHLPSAISVSKIRSPILLRTPPNSEILIGRTTCAAAHGFAVGRIGPGRGHQPPATLF